MSLTVSRVLLNPKVFNNGTTPKKYGKFIHVRILPSVVEPEPDFFAEAGSDSGLLLSDLGVLLRWPSCDNYHFYTN